MSGREGSTFVISHFLVDRLLVHMRGCCPDILLALRQEADPNSVLLSTEKSLLCFLCGKGFPHSALSQHFPQCRRKLEVDLLQIPEALRIPSSLMNFDVSLPSQLDGRSVSFYNVESLKKFRTLSIECQQCSHKYPAAHYLAHSKKCVPHSCEGFSCSNFL
jgi:hypothetical protein